jgi:hypothetical protein
MADETKVAGPLSILSDPDNVPMRTVDGVAICGIMGTGIAVLLTSNRLSIGPDGRPHSDHVVAARLRFDPKVAQVLHDLLGAQLKVLAAPQGKAN